jgi:hypothetical protein
MIEPLQTPELHRSDGASVGPSVESTPAKVCSSPIPLKLKSAMGKACTSLAEYDNHLACIRKVYKHNKECMTPEELEQWVREHVAFYRGMARRQMVMKLIPTGGVIVAAAIGLKAKAMAAAMAVIAFFSGLFPIK